MAGFGIGNNVNVAFVHLNNPAHTKNFASSDSSPPKQQKDARPHIVKDSMAIDLAHRHSDSQGFPAQSQHVMKRRLVGSLEMDQADHGRPQPSFQRIGFTPKLAQPPGDHRSKWPSDSAGPVSRTM